MNLQELRTLVDYHYWARDRLLDAVDRLSSEQLNEDLGNSFPSIRDTLVHLYGADRVWCDRWEREPPRGMPDPVGFPDVPSIRRAWGEQERKIRAVLERLGEEGVGHGGADLRRGQVTTMLRQLEQPPPASMDLITFYRERNAAAVRV